MSTAFRSVFAAVVFTTSAANASDSRLVYDVSPGYAAKASDIRLFPNLSPYDERTLSRPYNPGPKFIYAPIPKTITHHKNLHLPDPTCLAGCYPGKSKME